MVALAVAALAAGCISSPTEPQDQVEPTSVMITPDRLATTGGMPESFTAAVLDADGATLSGTSVDWSTSDPSVAVVDRSGLVWSFAEGTATATADYAGRGKSSPNGKAYGHSRKDAEVTVTEVAPDRPGQVGDLSVSSTTTSSATLSFTEVDDGTGSAADYVVRFQVSSMDWGSATDVNNGSCSVALDGTSPGSKVTCTVSNLAADTDYKFQLVAFRGSYPSDMVYGDLSNVASGSTPAPPDPTAQPQPGSAGHPNEPSGLSTIASVSFADSINAQVGQCTEASDPWKQSNSEYVADSSTPTGDGRVFRGKFPSGLDDGHSPFRFDCWGPGISPGGGAYQYDEIYVSVWLKVEGSDYENQSVGTKVLYFAYGTLDRYNDGAYYLGGTGSRSMMSDTRIDTRVSRIDDNDNDTSGLLVPNLPDAAQFKVGEWNHLELRAKANDINPTVDNGELQMWVNGALVTSINNWRYRSDAVPNAFYHLQFTPVWGGNGGDVRTRDDYWRVDELYISGR